VSRQYDEYDEDYDRERRPGGGGNAAAQVNGPAIGLLVTGILGILVAIANLVMNLAGIGMAQRQVGQLGGQAKEEMQMQMLIQGPVAIGVAVLALLIYVLVIVGAMKMKSLQSHGLAMTASILAMLPCSACCLLGLPMGIWSLITLSKPEVKAAFR